ncbi:MAG: hypothetical protein ACR2LK_13650 [Solirubrobacteraceae bacterium]
MKALPIAAAIALMSCGDDESSKRATPRPVEFEGDRGRGKGAKASARGVVDGPVSISIRVSAAPPQRVQVGWGLTCSTSETRLRKGGKATKGAYTTTPPNVRKLRLPSSELAFCAVSAQAQLRGRGRIRVTVLGSER